jgi:hypothetical protein
LRADSSLTHKTPGMMLSTSDLPPMGQLDMHRYLPKVAA